MKKVNVKYHIKSYEQFNADFQSVLDIFSDKTISHLEITLVMDTLDIRDVESIVNSIAKNRTFKEITNETIYTFIVNICPAREIPKILTKIKGLLSRIDLISTQENTELLRETFLALQKKKLPCSVVIKEGSLKEIEEIYQRGKLFGAPTIYEGTLSFDAEYLSLFKKWVYDKEGYRINIFSDILSQILLDYWGSKCQYKSCLTKYFSVDDEGMICGCKNHENEICNLREVHSLNEILSHDNFIKLLEKSISKRNNCKSSCEFYKLCQGGCPNSSNLIVEMCNDKHLFTAIQEIRELVYHLVGNSDYRTLNPAVREMILSSAASNKLFEKGMVD